ncbi:fumarate reductase subunit D [Acrocarpospora corrugata]|uniref:Fumarate reductase subunit D n=1 Tax=Acrocarpospora corrugata TaxID=35763 RepID=A0A5M3VU89_9ACTN|nr:fumarate reductase subunit FrdD [Acrocarpospora corrugata]GER98642.1 fumarate reductase subunit D [Acrocarpospora corrugata]
MSPLRRRAEPYLWLLFGGGGVVSALTLPALVLILGVLVPAGVLSRPDLTALLSNAVVRLALVGLVMLALFHAAHRIRFTAEELLGVARWDRFIALTCYGLALTGTVVTASILF